MSLEEERLRGQLASAAPVVVMDVAPPGRACSRVDEKRQLEAARAVRPPTRRH
jgi:hypothetical protein